MSDYSNLPQELLLEILVRLPVQDLVKSTAVCKSWNSVIKNPNFISTHLGKTISSTNSRRLLLFRLCSMEKRRVIEKYSLRLDNENVDEYKQLHFPSNKFRSVGTCSLVVGTCNGKAIRLPEPSVRVPRDELLKYGESSIATTTWDWDDYSLVDSKIELWVMKEYGVATSWTKVLTMEATESVQRVLFFRQDEQVFVVRKDESIASLDIKTKHSHEVLGVRSLEAHLVVDSYVESLVLLDKYCNSGWDVISIDGD
ncbi:hypothetical protein COLO4_10296 [Corchorus olitorius]|uniref:F-box domain-containing protein n=1 Tax=Corchorus olitorius TaxID=93759 RepID=A0A1R3K991_9ROSI|nr:hypothetical protein COLO4_10296 [Corchorus olitorius]